MGSCATFSSTMRLSTAAKSCLALRSLALTNVPLTVKPPEVSVISVVSDLNGKLRDFFQHDAVVHGSEVLLGVAVAGADERAVDRQTARGQRHQRRSAAGRSEEHTSELQ